MSALAHLGANDTPLKQKPTLQRHQSAIAATAESQPYPTTSVVSFCFFFGRGFELHALIHLPSHELRKHQENASRGDARIPR